MGERYRGSCNVKCYHDLCDNCKDSVDRINMKQIYKLKYGGAGSISTIYKMRKPGNELACKHGLKGPSIIQLCNALLRKEYCCVKH